MIFIIIKYIFINFYKYFKININKNLNYFIHYIIIMCDKGEIKRVAYSFTKKNGTKVNVKSTCVPDKGRTGKGPKLIVIPKEDQDLLGKYGYNLHISHEERIKILHLCTFKTPTF